MTEKVFTIYFCCIMYIDQFTWMDLDHNIPDHRCFLGIASQRGEGQDCEDGGT